jgi:hypothetical protein
MKSARRETAARRRRPGVPTGNVPNADGAISTALASAGGNVTSAIHMRLLLGWAVPLCCREQKWSLALCVSGVLPRLQELVRHASGTLGGLRVFHSLHADRRCPRRPRIK